MQTENTAAPSLGGWLMAAAAGAVAFGVAVVIGKYGFPTAAFFGALIFLVVGIIVGLPKAPRAPYGAAVAPASVAPVAVAVAPAAAVMMDPVMAPAAVTAPVAVMTAAATVLTASQPKGLSGPRNGKADDLKKIEGIGPAMEKLCHGLGFFHFDQLAAWTASEIAWVDENLQGFKGRVTRDKWVAQAKIICTEGMDAFLIRAKTNNY